MNRRKQQRAFTLIELLTVMAIITILISILTPALQTSRTMAKKTAVRAQINAMEVGLVAFSADQGEYVPSNAVFYASDPLNPTVEMDNWEVAGPSANLQGAHLLLDALVGRDFLGYDPKAPPPGLGGGGAPQYDRWDPQNDRRQPYIPVDGVDVTSNSKPPTDAFGGNPNAGSPTGEVQPEVTGSGNTPLLCRVFRDKFGWPILYYRASPVANQNTPIITTNLAVNNGMFGDGVYDGYDNFWFTSYEYNSGNPTHKIADAYEALPIETPTYGTQLRWNFAEFIRSLRASTYSTLNPTEIEVPRPVKSDRDIILSAGKDGIYGNLDDVANYNVLSEER